MKLADTDGRKLAGVLRELIRGIEELLLGGLTTASEVTRRLMEVSLQEASRLRLLRLSATLRSANDELGKFVASKPGFSRKRLCFFLNRCWLLAHGLVRALENNDEAGFTALLRTPAGHPVETLRVVTLGVVRKVVVGSFCAFDFRLRGLPPTEGRFVWSCVFQLPPNTQVPPEGFLQLPQKQGFKPMAFLEGMEMTLTKVSVTPDENATRITLGEASTVVAGEPFTDWARFTAWSPGSALERLRRQKPGPLDLDIELQEEPVLHSWTLGEPFREEEDRTVYPLQASGVRFYIPVNDGVEGEPLTRKLEELRKKPDPRPLYGLMHYERCRLVFQPLALIGPTGSEPITLSKDKTNMAALLKLIKF